MNEATQEYIALAYTIKGFQEKLRERAVVSATLQVNCELSRNRQATLLRSGEVNLDQVKKELGRL
jgi:hypothetical protein